MKRVVPLLCLACVLGIAATGYTMLGNRAADAIEVPTTRATSPPASTAQAALRMARRTCTRPALDAVIATLRARTAAAATDAEAWRLLAEALLERALQSTHLRGLAVGTPLFEELPAGFAADLDAGLAAVERARTLGDDSGDLYRVEASLMGQRITGLGTALRWNPRIEAALRAAGERSRDDPHLHTLLGLRKLLAPRLLGQEPEQALQHFEFAARALVDDERPAVFAAMASYLQQRRQQAVAWLEQAVARNPDNTFARVVLRRLRRDEPEPFGRDVTAEEVATAK